MENGIKILSPWIETSRKEGLLVNKSIPQGVDWCVVALGSLARYELTEKSDLDILVVTDNEEKTEEISLWLHRLMDRHDNICAVVRTGEECLNMFSEDFRSWIGIIEARPLGGNMKPWRSLRRVLSRQVNEIPRALWREKLRRSIETRHERYGKSVRLLEPNIKNSAGGLRDIHTVFWFTLLDTFHEIVRSCPEFTPRFSTVLERSPLHKRRQQIINRAREFYLHVRYVMHELTDMHQDYLDYDLQQQAAVKLGYGSLSSKDAVETFMREYLRNAREVHLALEKLFPPVSSRVPVPASIRGLKGEEGILRIADTNLIIDNRLIAEVFAYAHGQPGVIGEDITRRIDMEVTRKKVRPDDVSNRFLRRLFSSQEPIADILIHLNNKNILGAWIPEFGQLISFFQHNIYHYYTADEHTLLALKACEKLAGEEGYIARIYRRQQDKTPIKLGIFFHDIAKPISVADHEKKGVDIVRRVLPRLGLEQYTDETAFIVLHHLLMEQVAFRRDIHDAGTVNRFVEIVGTTQRLDWLILMTYADLCAVNPKVWTPWKEQLLCELHRLASRKTKPLEKSTLKGEMMPSPGERLGEVVGGRGADRRKRLLDKGESIDILFNHENGYSEITITTRDRPFLLASICAVLTYQDCNIIEAKIETTDDGTAMDTFRVVDIIDEGPLRPEQVNGIPDVLQDVLVGRKEAPDLIAQHRAKWKRRLRRTSNMSVRVDVEFHDQEPGGRKNGTIVELYSHDTIGLLYTIARILAGFELNISVAKIATRVDGVVDSFYVTDKNDGPLNDAVKNQLKETLLEALKNMNVI